MTRLAVWAAVLILAPAASGANPDPKSLAIPDQELTRARQLAGKLGDDVFDVRERATRDLFKMGRLALPIVEATLTTASDPEVQARCNWLLPKALAADQKAKLDTFLADADGKFDHDLPGWNELMKATGNSKAARELFVDMLNVKANAELFAGARNKEQFGPKLMARRAELYNRLYRFSPDGQRNPPNGPEVAALVLAEVMNTTPATDRRYQYAAFSSVTQQPAREYLNTAGKGEAYKKLLAHWLDTRTDEYELYSAMNTASTLNLKEVSATDLALRVLKRITAPGENKLAFLAAPYTKTQAIGVLARSGDKAHLPLIRKFFDDDQKMNIFRFVNGVNQQVEGKVADFALAMAVVLTDQNPSHYGFEQQTNNATSKFYYYNYSFASPEVRRFAFVKWGFWEARQKK